MRTPIIPLNQCLGNFKDPFPKHNMNQVDVIPTKAIQVYHEVGPSSYHEFVGFVHVDDTKKGSTSKKGCGYSTIPIK